MITISTKSDIQAGSCRLRTGVRHIGPRINPMVGFLVYSV